MEAFAGFGYGGLFLAAFLAATILPLSSEVVLVLLLAQGLNPPLLIAVATLGNLLGAVLNYALGRGGMRFLRRWRPSPDEHSRAAAAYRKYGAASLLFAWVPVIGDPLTVVAGALRVNLGLFLLLVGAGKLARYLAVGWAAGL
jgi:membrane protein YqaA with SNARE-associated domain